MNSVLNPKSSIAISFLSGMGLVALVSFAPRKGGDLMEKESLVPEFNETITNYKSISNLNSRSDTKSNPFRRIVEKKRKDSVENDKPLLNLKIDPEEVQHYMKGRVKLQEGLGSVGFQKFQILDSHNFRQDRGLEIHSGDITRRNFNWNQSSLQVDSSLSGLPSGGGLFREPNWGKYNRSNFRNLGHSSPNLDYLDINIPISRSLSAVFTASSNDIFDDRNRETQFRSYALTGISLKKGNTLSTRFLAGDRNLTLHRQNFNPAMPGSTSLQEFRRMGFDDREASGLQSFEWQTNLQPSKSVRLQTALFNNPGNQSRQSSASSIPDSGRMSLFLGEKYVIFNVKYSYQMSEQNRRNITSQWQPTQDSASLGFIMFLDPSQKYSLFLGGNQFNISQRLQGNQNSRGDQTSNLPSSFTASFRGRTGGDASSNFFVNFQNQPPGLWGLGMPGTVIGQNQENLNSKSFYEYATTLGLEVNF